MVRADFPVWQHYEAAMGVRYHNHGMTLDARHQPTKIFDIGEEMLAQPV